jgi:hypothetical protein
VLSSRWQGWLGPATHTPTTQRRQRDYAGVQGQGARPTPIGLACHGARHRLWHAPYASAASATSAAAAAEAAVTAGGSMVDGASGEGGGEGGGG